MKILIVLFLIVAASVLARAEDQIFIRVGEAKVKKSVLAIPQFDYLGSPAMTGGSRGMANEITQVIEKDLDTTGYFQLMKKESFLEDTSKVGLRPLPDISNGFSFASWKQVGAEFLIRGGFSLVGNKLTLEAYIYHVPTAKAIHGATYEGPSSDLRRIAHRFSNDVVKKLTGKEGWFLSRLVVASDRDGKKFKEIYTMDWDGSRVDRVTDHKSIALSPNWSPDGKSIVYTAFTYHQNAKIYNPNLWTYELDTKRRFVISTRKGMNSGAVFWGSNSFLLTISQGGTPDLYKMSTEGANLTRITNGPGNALNVEPALSPDGKRIAFSSDRSGRPMIYVVGSDGTNPNRITFAGKYNASPAWSPDGKKIAFAGWDSDHFDIFVMDDSGHNMERLTSAKKNNGKWSNNEDPVFTPDGRHVIFTSDRSGNTQLYIVNSDGTNERRLIVDRFNYWRPKLHKGE